MKLNLKYILLILCFSHLFSCSSPMDKKFNRKTIQEDFKAIHGKDTTADKKLVGYLFLLELRGNKLEEMTYREILEEGKKIESDLENDFSSKK